MIDSAAPGSESAPSPAAPAAAARTPIRSQGSSPTGDPTSQRPASPRTLVLGGGGVSGIGWEVGVLAGLLGNGIDVRAADQIIGTSAGSFVGTNLAAGVDWNTEFELQASAAEREPSVSTDPAVYQGWARAFATGGASRDAVGRGFGRVARESPSTVPVEVRTQVARSRLHLSAGVDGRLAWPERMRVAVTDAESGEVRLLGREDGVPIEVAAAASGAVPGVWPSVSWEGRTWIDAGMVSSTNALLASGSDRVIVLAPMPEGHGLIPGAAEDVAELPCALLISPDEGARAAIGPNPYDPSRAGAAAVEGRRQGRELARAAAEVWGTGGCVHFA